MRQCGYTAADAVVQMTDAQAQALADSLAHPVASPKLCMRHLYFHKPTGRWRVCRREQGALVSYGSSATEEGAKQKGRELGVLVQAGRRAVPFESSLVPLSVRRCPWDPPFTGQAESISGGGGGRRKISRGSETAVKNTCEASRAGAGAGP